MSTIGSFDGLLQLEQEVFDQRLPIACYDPYLIGISG